MAKDISEIVKKYHRTEKGVLALRYAKMKFDAKRLGLDILPQNVFKVLSREDDDFRRIYYDYRESGFDKKLSPVLERIDSKKGFTQGNLKWIYKRDKKIVRRTKKELRELKS